MSSACVIPPALDVEAGNTPPQVIRQQTNPDPESELQVSKTPEGDRPETTFFTVAFRDPDPEPVWLRLFINAEYDRVLGEREVPPTSDGERVGQLSVDGLCDGLLTTPDVEVYLADTPFVNQGEDLRITTVVEGRKGARDHERWRIACTE